jgi:hypothetical protein
VRPLPRVVCRGWISPTGFAWKCLKPEMHKGEPGGGVETWQCKTCMDRQIKAWERKAALNADRTRRRLAHREPWDPDMKIPADPFEGFREPVKEEK